MLKLHDETLLKDTCLIGGQWVHADDGATVEVRNPATQQLLARVPRGGAELARQAISAAHEAGAAWRSLTAEDRSATLRRWNDRVVQSTEDLALLLTSEQGKPLQEARSEIAYAASYIEWYAEEAKRLEGEILASPWPERRLMVTREPIGVCAAITPWNFPAAMVTRKLAPALAAGCTVVLKPASQTPLTALALAELAQQAGVPAGVLNVVTGSAAAIGAELTSSHLVRKVSFTGSTEIGRLLAAQSAPSLKKLSLELGGNAPFIVFDDADIEAAVAGAIASKFRNTGQTCVCTNRLLVQRGVHDRFSDALTTAVQSLRVGDGTLPNVEQGPLIDAAALAKVEELVADALAHGARVATGGRRHRLGGAFYEPTVLLHANEAMKMASEEVFGPVAPVFVFDTEDDALQMSNNTEFGLASYVFTQNLGRAFRVSEGLQFGMVGVNTGLISTAVAPFGGIKQSGYGREGSRHGIEEYTQLKYTCLDFRSRSGE